jgi:large subunit ribosomal protein L22
MSEKTYKAVHRQAPMTPRKARYVVDLIRGKPVNDALDILRFCPRRAAPMLSKVMMSALATAQLDAECDHGRLHVIDVRADDGMTLKRWKPRSRGQMFPLLLHYSHLTVVLGEREPAQKRVRTGKRAGKSRSARVAASRAAQGGTTVTETETGAAESSQGNE